MPAEDAADSRRKGLGDAYARLYELANAPMREVEEGAGCPQLMAAVTSLAGEGQARPVRADRLERARLAWKQHIQSGVPLSQADASALCWAAEVAILPEFVPQLSSNGPLRSRALRGLMSSYHESWSASHDSIANYLRASLVSAKRVRGIVEQWASIPDELIGRAAPDRFAEGCIASRRSASDRLSSLDIAASSLFGTRVVGELASRVSQRAGSPDLFAFALERVFKEDDQLLSPADWGKAFDALVSSCGPAASDETRQKLIDLALQTRGLPDPRMHLDEWQNVPQQTRERIMQWLSKEDLRFFFDLLMQGQQDPQGRYRFWIDYAGRALRSRVVVGETDLLRLRRQLEEIQSRGRTYARMTSAARGDAHVSAFIMDFGAVTIVEFSKPNSACYIYKNDPSKLYLDLSKCNFGWYQLKNTRAARYYAHSGGWEHKFRRVLAQHGIRPE